MPSYRIVCIIKPDINSPLEEITKIGYYETAYKPRVIIPIEDAIKRIDANPQEFYIRSGNKTIFAKVEKPAGRKHFIKTIADGAHDSLLSIEQMAAH